MNVMAEWCEVTKAIPTSMTTATPGLIVKGSGHEADPHGEGAAKLGLVGFVPGGTVKVGGVVDESTIHIPTIVTAAGPVFWTQTPTSLFGFGHGLVVLRVQPGV